MNKKKYQLGGKSALCMFPATRGEEISIPKDIILREWKNS